MMGFALRGPHLTTDLPKKARLDGFLRKNAKWENFLYEWML